jgi:hypothetical protein
MYKTCKCPERQLPIQTASVGHLAARTGRCENPSRRKLHGRVELGKTTLSLPRWVVDGPENGNRTQPNSRGPAPAMACVSREPSGPRGSGQQRGRCESRTSQCGRGGGFWAWEAGARRNLRRLCPSHAPAGGSTDLRSAGTRVEGPIRKPALARYRPRAEATFRRHRNAVACGARSLVREEPAPSLDFRGRTPALEWTALA